MGWLELLPLLKRLLPLLTRVAPLLEGFVANRGLVREDLQASLNEFKAQMNRDLDASRSGHRDLTAALTEATERLSSVSTEVSRLRVLADVQAERLSSVEAQLAGLRSLLLFALVLLGVAVLLVGVVLYFVLTHNG